MSDQSPEHMEIRFFYEKSRDFRVVHVDGAYGGLTPSGKNVAVSLYSERRPIPREQVFDVGSDGRLADRPKATVSKQGLFREVEVCAIMDIAAAQALHAWLGRIIEASAGTEGAGDAREDR